MELLTTKEAAQIMKVHIKTVQRWIREGKIEAIKLNSGGPRDPYLIDCREVDDYRKETGRKK